MSGKNHLIRDIIDVFLTQIPEELQIINDGVAKINYAILKSLAHPIRSSVSIMGISSQWPVFRVIEDMGAAATDIEKIKGLNKKLNLICKKAIKEIELEICNYNWTKKTTTKRVEYLQNISKK